MMAQQNKDAVGGGGGGGSVADDEDDKTAHKDLPANVYGGMNDLNVIGQIVDEYEQRLKQQVALAKEDIVSALEEQIKVSDEMFFYVLFFFLFALLKT